MFMLVSACNHIHKNGVTHRDVKPQNILINVKENTIKVIDFGLSKIDSEDKHSGFLVGTPNFMSPEIYERDGDQFAYKPPCDMFAIGVIMYILVTGILPFNGTHEEIKNQILYDKVVLGGSAFHSMSNESRDFLMQLLQKIPSKRLKAENAMNHEFFKVE